MRELDVGALPIADSAERLTGILTDRDIVIGVWRWAMTRRRPRRAR